MSGGRDWGGLRGILAEAEAVDAWNREREANPLACPLCGTPLQIRGDGVRNCPLGHWRAGGGAGNGTL